MIRREFGGLLMGLLEKQFVPGQELQIVVSAGSFRHAVIGGRYCDLQIVFSRERETSGAAASADSRDRACHALCSSRPIMCMTSPEPAPRFGRPALRGGAFALLRPGADR